MMAAYEGAFESSRNIQEKKLEKRKHREDILQQAKKKYEDEERREAARKARGEHTWMLPEIDQRLEEISQEYSVTSKKKRKEKSKKKKKEKKKKTKKEKATGQQGNGSSDSSEDSDEWVEAPSQSGGVDKAWKVSEEATPTVNSTSSSQRDEWMTFDFLAMKTTSVAERRAQKEAEKEVERERERTIEQAGLHKLELNPYWKDGGSGLPPEDSAGSAVKKAAMVADGGLSWLRKSYQRMKEQAEREHRSVDDVVAERYGSVEQFQKKLQEAEDAAFTQSADGNERRWRGEGDQQRWRRGEGDQHRWRRGEGEEQRGRRGEGEEQRGRRGEEDEQRGRRGEGDETRWKRGEGDEPRRRRGEGDEPRWRRGEGDEPRWRRGERDEPRWRRGEGDEPRWRRGEADDQKETGRRDLNRDRYQEREGDGRRDQERERDQGRERERDGEKEKGQSRESPLSSFRGRFLKPSDFDDLATPGSGWRKPGVTVPASSNKSTVDFLKPRDDDDDDDDDDEAPAWRKSSAGKHTKQKEEEKRVREDTGHPKEIQQQKETGTALVEKSSSDSEEDSGEEEDEATLLTDEEMNKLGAKLVKAELMGNTALMESLKAQLDAARKAREIRAQKSTAQPPTQVPEKTEVEQELVLFRTDQSGRAWPVHGPSQHVEPKGGRRKRKAIETHVAGERVRYFEDDDGMDLREMVRREKMSTAEDQNALYSRMAGRLLGKQDGENYTLDDMFVSSAAQKERVGLDEERQRNRAMEETRRFAGQIEKCPHCFTSPQLPKHLIIAIGTKVYLSLPNSVSLTEGHCLIAPLQHHCSSTGLDEDVWTEMQVFRRALVQMFEAQDLDCVFLETHMNPKRRLHLLYECVPLPRELGDMAPIYFKKALQEADEEWAMNKKVVDLSSKNIRQAIPRGLPYFSVDFGMQGGFAHVIENEQKFPHYFGKEILGGMLDLEPRRWRKLTRENFDDQRKKVLQFSQWWKPFNCTKTCS